MADEVEVQERVEKVIDDLARGQVMPKQVERLGDAVSGAKRDQAVGRAIGGGWR